LLARSPLLRAAGRQVVDVAIFLLLILVSASIMATQLFGLTRYLYIYSSDEHINFRSTSCAPPLTRRSRPN